MGPKEDPQGPCSKACKAAKQSKLRYRRRGIEGNTKSKMVHSKRARERFHIVGVLFRDLQARQKGLQGYRLQVGSYQKHLACCRFPSKTIAFDATFLDVASLDTIHHVLIHECAHALCGRRRRAHGPAWQRMCRRLGQEAPQVTYDVVRTITAGFDTQHEAKEALRRANTADYLH